MRFDHLFLVTNLLVTILGCASVLADEQPAQPASGASLSDVQGKMESIHRRLASQDAGKETQREQSQVVESLSALIKMAEEQERQSKSSASAAAASQSQPGGATPSQSPGSQSGQTGGGSRGADTPASPPPTRVGPASPWSTLRERQRDPVFHAIQEKFPARYQQLIEQYYKSFQGPRER